MNYCTYNNLTNNTIYENVESSIYLYDSYSNSIENNTMLHNGIVLYGYETYKVINNITQTNTVNGKILYYYNNTNNLAAADFTNAGQVILVNVNNSVISNLNVSEASRGIALHFSRNNNITNNNANLNYNSGIFLFYSINNSVNSNNANNCSSGIFLKYGSDENIIRSNNITYCLDLSDSEGGICLSGSYSNQIIDNNVSYNTLTGIYLSGADQNNITGNEINNNGEYGIALVSGTDTVFVWNNSLSYNIANNSIDNAMNNQWHNGTLGNFWGDYNGKDTDDNGIGDPAYPYDIPGSAGEQDIYPIFWDAPVISVVSPANNTHFNATAPAFTISVDEGINDSLWYKLQSDANEYNFTSPTFQINQTAWDNAVLVNSSVTITFYINDSRGYSNTTASVVIKDPTAPIITIISPTENDTFNFDAPQHNITILEGFLNGTWYMLGSNQTKHFISANSTGIINQTEWDSFPDGNITIHFYANDTAGNVGYSNVTVIKETSAPTISILSPSGDASVEVTAPNYSLNITTIGINATWYRIWDGTSWTINYTYNETAGTINQTIWTSIWTPLSHEDVIVIQFFVNDSIGREANATVQVKKYAPPSTNGNGDTPPVDIPDFIPIIIIVGALVGIIGVVVFFIKKGGLGDEVGRIERIHSSRL